MILIPNLNIGGAEKYAVDLSNSLVSKGYIVTLCTIGSGRELKSRLDKCVFYYELGINYNITLLKILKMKKIIKARKIEVIHSHLYKADLINYLSSFFTKEIVRVSTEHSTSSRRKKIAFFGEIQRIIYRRIDVITTISDAVRKHVLEWTGVNSEKVVTIHNGTNFSIKPKKEIIRKILERKKSEYVIGTLARLEIRKDLQTSLKAINHLVYHLNFTKFKYVIYGDGPQKEHLKSLAIQFRIDKYIRFEGFCSDIESVIDEIDIHILPSIEEGFGISIIETMARGIPNIGTYTGGIPEVISDDVDGFLVECGDYVALANKIYQLLNNNEMILDFGLVAASRVERDFTLDGVVLKFISIYEKER